MMAKAYSKVWGPMAKLVVVDDEPDVRFLLKLIFESAGHEVVAAPHGAAALQRVKDFQPDLVVTDAMMPVMGGRELIERLRSDPVTAEIPILLISGQPDRVTTADAVLGKPFGYEEVLEKAGSLLQDDR